MARPSGLICQRVSPSAAVELAWLLDLLVQDAPYAEPALEELDRSLLPGVAAMRRPIQRRYLSLWRDGVSGCAELLLCATAGGSVVEVDPRRLFTWLSMLPKQTPRRYQLLSEPSAGRSAVRRRLQLLDSDVSLRRAYRNILIEVWELAEGAWTRRGRGVAHRAAAEWVERLTGARGATSLINLMPPRHPLSRANRAPAAKLLRARGRFSLVPVYFCMSGGLVADLDDSVLIAVPASAREPIRRSRDAAFVADRLRLLAESTRVRILIHLLSEPSAVMETSRALHISQPSVSGHIQQLAAAGLVRPKRAGSRRLYVTAPQNVERLLEDARATLARWVPPRAGEDES